MPATAGWHNALIAGMARSARSERPCFLDRAFPPRLPEGGEPS